MQEQVGRSEIELSLGRTDLYTLCLCNNHWVSLEMATRSVYVSSVEILGLDITNLRKKGHRYGWSSLGSDWNC
jgi:hypothetical protein